MSKEYEAVPEPVQKQTLYVPRELTLILLNSRLFAEPLGCAGSPVTPEDCAEAVVLAAHALEAGNKITLFAVDRLEPSTWALNVVSTMPLNC
jgi:hypothetical protein